MPGIEKYGEAYNQSFVEFGAFFPRYKRAFWCITFNPSMEMKAGSAKKVRMVFDEFN